MMTDVADSGPAVHLLAGLNGAGKTTYARRLQAELPAVRFTQDEWILKLHPLRYDDPARGTVTRSCRELIWEVAVQVLAVGTDVVLDWNSWSRQQRREWSSRAAETGYPTVVHYLRVSPETAIAQANRRAARSTPGAYVLDAAAIRHMAAIFEEPGQDEGLEIRVVRPGSRAAGH
jgi:hypothetical protein